LTINSLEICEVSPETYRTVGKATLFGLTEAGSYYYDTCKADLMTVFFYNPNALQTMILTSHYCLLCCKPFTQSFVYYCLCTRLFTFYSLLLPHCTSLLRCVKMILINEYDDDNICQGWGASCAKWLTPHKVYRNNRWGRVYTVFRWSVTAICF